MNNKPLCPECGGVVSQGVAEGLCTRCLVAQGLSLAPTPPTPEENLSGGLPRSFGDYELLEEIARGGMGVIYRAWQRSLDRTVAIKMLLFGPHAGAEQIKRFRTEASAAASLQHPNIVAIHDVGVHQGEHYLVMDLVDGPNLAKLIRNDPLPPERAARYLKIIAESVHYAHEKGILHRDIKPSNVLIDSADEPRVTDFGLAKRLDGDSSLTLSGQVMGSPSYMPPEQAGSSRNPVSRASDVYSLGAMLYHMVVGHPPFFSPTVAETIQQVLNAEPVSPRLVNPNLPDDVATICLKCLEKDPVKRYQTAQQLADELNRFLNEEPILARQLERTNFQTTLWANSEYRCGYLGQADYIIPERRYLFHMVGSFLSHFARGIPLRICDLGCGDGALAQHLARILPEVTLTLVDGAPAMLAAAKERLGHQSSTRFIEGTFSAIIEGSVLLGQHDAFVSSLAIHHLTQMERTALFFLLKDRLTPGGWFLNVDCVLPDESAFIDWQYELWREWILENEKRQPSATSLQNAPDQARRNPDNKLSRLSSQLNALRRAGFESVDCLYRNGIFVVYCGRTPTNPAHQISQ